MKRKTKLFICLMLLAFLFSACKHGEKDNILKNKECILGGAHADTYAMGAKPVNANHSNCEALKVGASLYRIFYCDDCWNEQEIDSDFFNKTQ